MAVWLLWCKRVDVAAVVKSGRGHSQHRPSRPRSRLRIWRMGTGRTAWSRFVVRKSQKSFGQKNPLIEAAIWSVVVGVSTLAVRMGIGGTRETWRTYRLPR